MILNDMNGKVYDEANPLTVDSPGAWAVTLDSAINTAATLTRAAVGGKRHYITGIEVSISGAAAANDITIDLRDNATVIWREIIGSGAPRGERVGVVFSHPVMCGLSVTASLAASAGGAGVVATLNITGYTL